MISWKKKIFLIILIAALGLSKRVSAQDSQVLTGIDVLEAEHFSPLVGKNVGLITNQTGIDRHWQSDIDLLYHAKGVRLVALFSPEHGIRGIGTTAISNGVDSATGLPIYSLFGKTRKPTAEMLKGIDALVFDIQDVGTRFYTYIGTMKECMEAAAEHHIEFFVLDRPNPINGVDVEGPVLDSSQVFDLAGTFSIPIRHGMTMGELALMFNKEGKIGADLHVIKMKGWKRSMWFDQTGLPWVSPSPKIKNLYEAELYPGIGLLERTDVTDKQGLTRPFEEFGAPWINAVRLAAELNSRNIPGVRFVPIRFVPAKESYANEKYLGQMCEGVAIDVINRDALHPVACGIEVLESLYKLYPNRFDVDEIWHVTRSRKLIEEIKHDAPITSIKNSWQPALKKFIALRRRFLLY
ncbi:MAG: DUF1343 domain-containing protein [Bacteroidetes bacterium]|nr:DUF1343 domain-containing protein [Bacteroidota bacterium]